jgi:CheY-like chemotaxis protein
VASDDPSSFPVLVVEDNPDDVLLIGRAFNRAKLANPLQVVGNGEEAVAYLTGQGVYADRRAHPQPLLILLDLKLPRMSGLEVLQWRRQQDPQLQRIPVIVLTSSRESSDVNRAYELGANTYLMKPVQFDGLLELVKQLGIYWMMLAELPAVASP